MNRLICLGLACCLVFGPALAAFAQSSPLSVAEPIPPADPDPRSGSAAPTEGHAGCRFTFTPPKMPDFSSFRQTTTRTNSGSNVETASQTVEQASFTPLQALPDSLARALASLTAPAAAAPTSAAPRVNIPERFYRPSGYRSFTQERLENNAAENADAPPLAGQ